MSLTITTLANSSAASQTWTLVGRDRQSSEWLNTTDTLRDTRIFVKTNVLKNQGPIPVRRTLVSVVTKVPTYYGEGSQVSKPETVTVNFTITASEKENNPNLPLTVKQDAVAFLENFLSNTSVEQLLRGEV